MSTATIPRLADLVKARGDAPPANIPGFWINAGTPVSEPYPCSCWYSPCRYEKCPDRMRTEGDALPEGCCGRGAAQRMAEPGFVPRRPQTAVEPSGDTGTPGEARKSVSGGLRGVREAACECATPWDPPPPLLLISASKEGPVRSSTALDAKTRDPRGDADKILADMGLQRLKPWRDGRHVLLPPSPGARGKTRPCWHAPLPDGRLAVLDTPDETGSGVHCPDCHANFANAGAYQVHRQRLRGGRETCKDPASVLVVEHVEVIPARTDLVGRITASAIGHVLHGVPVLRRGVGGVWQIDPLAPWGAKGPALTPEEASGVWARAQERLAASAVVCRGGHRSRWQCRSARCRHYQPQVKA